jgi:hypothetical protein
VKAVKSLLVAVLLVLTLQATAEAADPVLARDTLVGRVHQLGGVTLYQRLTNIHKPPPHRAWVRVVNGKSRIARHIPARPLPGRLGRDAKGRIVFTYATEKVKAGIIVSQRWMLYDVMRDSSRPVKGLPALKRCSVSFLTIWRTRMAYEADCKSPKQSGIFLKTGNKTTPVAPGFVLIDMVQRGDSLAGIVEDGNGDFHLYRLLDGGRKCVQPVPSGYGPGDHEWRPSGVWFSGSHIVWTMGSFSEAPSFAVLAAKRTGKCQTLGPTGILPFTPETTSVRALTVEAGRLVYAGGKVIKAHQLPSTPSTDPPANDNFEQAEMLPTAVPFTINGRIGYGTRQAGEPALNGATRTVWYAFRPTSTGTVYVSAEGDFTLSYGVFTGSSVGTLTQIPPGDTATQVQAEAGKTYWIAIGSLGIGSDSTEPNYRPFFLTVGLSPPPPQ